MVALHISCTKQNQNYSVLIMNNCKYIVDLFVYVCRFFSSVSDGSPLPLPSVLVVRRHRCLRQQVSSHDASCPQRLLDAGHVLQPLLPLPPLTHFRTGHGPPSTPRPRTLDGIRLLLRQRQQQISYQSSFSYPRSSSPSSHLLPTPFQHRTRFLLPSHSP